MVTRNLFGPSVIGGGSHSSHTREIDLRAEFHLILFGNENSPRHGHLVLIRHARRDSELRPLPCSCVSNRVYKNADPTCVYCDGEGFYWDEKWYWCFSQKAGNPDALKYLPFGAVKVDYHTFYFTYDTPILWGDKIVEVRLDTEGTPLVPYVRRAIYTPSTVDEKRSDNGRIEYIVAYCREGDAIRPENPTSNVRK